MEDKLVFWFTLIFGLVAMLVAPPVHPETATVQSKEPANTSERAKAICPKGMKITSTFSQSTWNVGGWPLWRTVCIGEVRK